MTVDSYLELYTTLYGWALFGVFRDILIDTGLVYVPFIVILVGTWMESHQSSSIEGADAAWMVRVMEVELFTAFVVIMICFMPLMPLQSINLKYTPTADATNPNPTTATPNQPNSSGYSASFPNPPSSIDVPLWWYGVMGASAGFNEAVRGGVSGASSNLAVAEGMAGNLSIADPGLRNEVVRFQKECFEPARTKYLANQQSAAAAAAIGSYGEDDTDWIGSHAFQDDPDLYASLRAAGEVPGFALDLTGDDADLSGNSVLPAWSRPNCLRWWSDQNSGLKARMIVGAQNGTPMIATFASMFPSLVPAEVEDAIARRVERVNVPLVASASASESSWKDIPQTLMGAYGSIGEGWKAWASAPMIMLFGQTAQPLVLLAIYMFLALILVAGKFSFRVMFLGAIAIFTVKSWSAWWYIASWLYDHMLVAMYPTTVNLMHAVLQLNLDDAMKRVVVNTVLIGMYVGFPLIWSSMLGWIGFHVASGVSNLGRQMMGIGAQSGAVGANAAKRAGVGAAKLAVGGAKGLIKR